MLSHWNFNRPQTQDRRAPRYRHLQSSNQQSIVAMEVLLLGQLLRRPAKGANDGEEWYLKQILHSPLGSLQQSRPMRNRW